MMTTPEDSRKPARLIYDYEICADQCELQQLIGYINRSGYELTGFAQGPNGAYTVIFRRAAYG